MTHSQLKTLLTIVSLLLVLAPGVFAQSWRFVVVGDTHVGSSDTIADMVPFMIADSIDCILIPGDLVEGGLAASGAELKTQLNKWQSLMQPIYEKGIGVYPIYGNHEDDAHNDTTVWNSIFSGEYALPQNGPSGEKNFTYSVNHKNALFLALDDYKAIHTINQDWLDAQFAANAAPHIFVFGHEAAFKVFHGDCLDDSISARNTFWQSLSDAGVKTYFCGHDHFVDVARIDDGDGNEDNDVYQYLVGTGGGWLMPQYSNYNGDNDDYTPERVFHEMEHGYALVEVSGEGADDKEVSITWKELVWDEASLTHTCVATSHVINYTLKSTSEIASLLHEARSVYPNPATESITLSGLEGVVKVYNTNGLEVWSGLVNGSQDIDVSAFSMGVYLIHNKGNVLKFIIENN